MTFRLAQHTMGHSTAQHPRRRNHMPHHTKLKAATLLKIYSQVAWIFSDVSLHLPTCALVSNRSCCPDQQELQKQRVFTLCMLDRMQSQDALFSCCVPHRKRAPLVTPFFSSSCCFSLPPLLWKTCRPEFWLPVTPSQSKKLLGPNNGFHKADKAH